MAVPRSSGWLGFSACYFLRTPRRWPSSNRCVPAMTLPPRCRCSKGRKVNELAQSNAVAETQLAALLSLAVFQQLPSVRVDRHRHAMTPLRSKMPNNTANTHLGRPGQPARRDKSTGGDYDGLDSRQPPSAPGRGFSSQQQRKSSRHEARPSTFLRSRQSYWPGSRHFAGLQ